MDRLDARDLERIRDLAEAAGLSDDPQVRRLIRTLGLSGDPGLAQEAESLIAIRGRRRLANPFYGQPAAPPSRSVTLGRCDGHPIALTLEELKRSLLIVGQRGAGKTNLMRGLIRQIRDHGVTVWVFDQNRDYDRLARRDDVRLIRWPELRLNPLETPHLFVDVFTHRSGFQRASTRFTEEMVEQVLEIHQDRDRPPSIYELAEWIRHQRFPRGTQSFLSKDRVHTSLKELRARSCRIFDCAQGFPIKDLARETIVFDLAGLSELQKTVVAELLMGRLFTHLREKKQHKGQTDRPLSHLVVVDEAKHWFNRRLQEQITHTLPYADTLITESRSSGLGFVWADQEPKELASSLIENSHAKVQLQLGDGRDIELMARATGLSPRQRRLTFKLGVGQGVLKVSGREPVEVRVPLARLGGDEQRFGRKFKKGDEWRHASV